MRIKKRGGFTMIELLVVIAVIAILAAILFPVFAKARESAKRAGCLGNMKQLGVGIRMYCEDYNGLTLPVTYLFEGDDPRPVILGYQRYIAASLHTSTNDTSHIGMVWQCPSDTLWGFKGKGIEGWPIAAGYPGAMAGEMSYGYEGTRGGGVGRNLDMDAGINMYRGQGLGFVLTDRRFPEPPATYSTTGWTFSPHSRVYWDQSANNGYAAGLIVARLMPDLHCRMCKGWDRGYGLTTNPATGLPDYDLP